MKADLAQARTIVVSLGGKDIQMVDKTGEVYDFIQSSLAKPALDRRGLSLRVLSSPDKPDFMTDDQWDAALKPTEFLINTGAIAGMTVFEYRGAEDNKLAFVVELVRTH